MASSAIFFTRFTQLFQLYVEVLPELYDEVFYVPWLPGNVGELLALVRDIPFQVPTIICHYIVACPVDFHAFRFASIFGLVTYD